jgi:hypothetical protein
MMFPFQKEEVSNNDNSRNLLCFAGGHEKGRFFLGF